MYNSWFFLPKKQPINIQVLTFILPQIYTVVTSSSSSPADLVITLIYQTFDLR